MPLFFSSVCFDDGASNSTMSLIYDLRELKYTYIIMIWQHFYEMHCKYSCTLDSTTLFITTNLASS